MSFTVLTRSTSMPCPDCGTTVAPRQWRLVQFGSWAPWCPSCLERLGLARVDDVLRLADELVRLIGREAEDVAVAAVDLAHGDAGARRRLEQAAVELTAEWLDERDVLAVLGHLDAAASRT